MKNETNTYHILINQDSGSVLQIGVEKLRRMIGESALAVEELEILKAEDFFNKIKIMKEKEVPLLIGGGDGTIKSCADILLDSGRAFGILPLGTMNLLACDLNIPLNPEKALNAYAHGHKAHKIDVGMVNEDSFLCCVGIGTMPEGSEFREDNRDQNPFILMPRLTVFVLDQMSKAKHRMVEMALDGKKKRFKTAALVISNNQYSPDKRLTKNNFFRSSLQDGILGVYSATPRSIWDRLRLIARLQFGNWRGDTVVKEWNGKTISLNTKNSCELISLDGETKNMKMPLNFWINQEALTLLVPSQE